MKVKAAKWFFPNRTGFTLIELLVVISIMALLLSILMPALRRARVMASRVACQSNLRQIGIGVEMYKSDYDGKYPPARTADPSASHYDNLWPSRLIPYIAHSRTEHSHEDADKIFQCPRRGVAHFTERFSSGAPIVSVVDNYSYAMNSQQMPGWGDRYIFYGFYHQQRGGFEYSFSEMT